MLYRAEIMADNRVLVSRTFNKASHPDQAVRRVIKEMLDLGRSPSIFNVYVMNERGERWRYTVRKNMQGKYQAHKDRKSNSYLPKDVVDTVFAGNATIVGVHRT